MIPPKSDHSKLSHWDAWLKKKLRRFVADDELAQDVSQDVWLVRLKRKVGAESTGPAWLVGAARNIFRRSLEAESRRRRREWAAARREPDSSPEESAGVRAEIEDLRRALARLDPTLFEAVRLRWFEALGPKDAAARLGISVEAFRGRLKRAHAKLREALRRDSDRSTNLAVLPLGNLGSEALEAGAAEPLIEVGATPSAFSGCMVSLVAGAILAAMALVRPIFRDAAETPNAATGAVSDTAAERRIDPSRNAPRRPAALQGFDASADSDTSSERSAAIESPRSESASAEPTDGMLRVRIVSEVDGAPLPGIRIRFEPGVKNMARSFPVAISGADGSCDAVRLAPGNWGINTGRTSSFGVVRMPSGGLNDYLVKVPKGVELSGVVTDEQGRPIAHADVIHSLSNVHVAGPHIATSTDVDGRFSLPAALPGENVVVRAAGFALSRPMPVPFGVESERLEVRLSREAGLIEGSVVGPSGAPIADAMVHVGPSLSAYFAARRRVFAEPAMAAATRTNADGRFRLPWLSVGSQVLTVHHRRFLTHESDVLVSAGLAGSVVVPLERGAVVHGRIGLEDGRPLEGVSVSVFGEGDIEARYDFTDAEGRYSVDGVAAGRRETRAHIAGRAAITGSIDVPSGGRAIWNAEFPERLAVEGRVSDADGAIPRRIVMLSLFELRGEAPRQFVASTLLIDGRFHIEVPPGSTGRFEIDLEDAQGHIQSLNGVRVGDPNLEIELAR